MTCLRLINSLIGLGMVSAMATALPPQDRDASVKRHPGSLPEYRDIPADIKDFFEESDYRDRLDRPQDNIRQRPEGLGAWRRPAGDQTLYALNRLKESLQLSGHVIDSKGYHLDLILEHVKDGNTFPVRKGNNGGGTWFSFVPAGNDYFYIGVSGTKAGRYHGDRGLLYVDPLTPSAVRLDDLADSKTKLEFRKTGEKSGVFSVTNPNVDAQNYLFEMIAEEDGKSFYLEHISGLYVGTSTALDPIYITANGKVKGVLNVVGILLMHEWLKPDQKTDFRFRLKLPSGQLAEF